MTDRYAHTVGFVVAGVGLAATFLDWPADAALASTAATAFAVVAVAAFAARRHGVDVPALDYGAAAGGIGLLLAATVGVVAVTLFPASAVDGTTLSALVHGLGFLTGIGVALVVFVLLGSR